MTSRIKAGRWFACAFFLLVVLFLSSFLAGYSSAQPGFSLSSDAILEGSNIYLNISYPGVECLAVVVITDVDSGVVVRDGLVNVLDGNASVGPFSLLSGNYSANATLWVVNGSSLSPVFIERSFSVSAPAEANNDEEALMVVATGIGIVFFTLGLLTATTLVTGRALKNRASPVTGGGGSAGGEDIERIAAIAAAIRLRGD